MTGMDVLRRCACFEQDAMRLRQMEAFTRDAAMRVTRSPDAQGHGAGMDKTSALIARADELARGLRARMAAHDMEVVEALRLIGGMDVAQNGAVLYGRYVEGMTYAALAIRMATSEDAVRSMHRRAVRDMEATATRLETIGAYRNLRAEEFAAFHPRRENPWIAGCDHL